MDILDLIEFYGFTPYDFLANVYDDLIDCLKTELEEFPKKEKNLMFPILEKSLNNNFKIFEIFTIKKVLEFPKGFSYERKITDLRSDVNIKEHKEKIHELMEERKQFEKKKTYLTKRLKMLELKNKNYETILESKMPLAEIIENIKHLKNTLDQIKAGSISKDMQMDPILGELMTYKEVQDSIRNSHLESLREKGDLKSLIKFNKENEKM